MHPNPKKRPGADHFAGIEEATQKELREAKVINNYVDHSLPEPPKPKKLKTIPLVTRLLEKGSYLPEAEDGIPMLLRQEPEPLPDGPLPVRILRNFFIFDSHSLTLVSLSSLWKSDTTYEACGLAIAYAVDKRDNTDIKPIPVRTSIILRYPLDIEQEDIRFQTQFACYILRLPAAEYSTLYIPFYTKEMLLRLILRCILFEPDTNKENLLLDQTMDPLLHRYWTAEDLQNCKYSVSELTEAIAAIPGVHLRDIKDAPLLRLILEPGESFNEMSDGSDDQSQKVPSRAVRGPAPRRRRRTQPVKPGPPAITPIVEAIISPYFEHNFTVVGTRPLFLDDEKLSRGQPQVQVSDDNNYNLRDFVIVNEGDIEDQTTMEFAQIVSLNRRKKRIHVRWFIHGSKTILQEVAHGQELFLSIADKCRDIHEDSIVSKCDVVRISLAQHAAQDWPTQDTYFYSCGWDRMNPAGFIEVVDDQVKVLPSGPCLSCVAHDTPISSFISDTKCTIQSIEYHQDDYIRYEATSDDQFTCSIGLINTIIKTEGGVKLRVYRLGRERDKKGPGYFAEPALFLTSIGETVLASSVLGKCLVLHSSEFELMHHTWLERHPGCFYVMSKALNLSSPLTPLPLAHFRRCQICHHLETEKDQLEMQCKKEIQLSAFDPFVGVGGFGLGLAQGCSMKTILGVDNDPNAAETMRRNFPSETTVLTADSSKVLKKLVRGHKYKIALDQINFIYSGPPCQNYSGLNRHKTDTESPVFTTLSFVDHLHPGIFIMEAVSGFLHWKISQGSDEMEGSDEMDAGDLKLVLKALHFLGYNVKGQYLHAGSFGVPQSRNRFFIVATLPEWGVFEFPEISHAIRTTEPPKFGSYEFGDIKINSKSGKGTALHEVVTVAEALSDLPLFDWTHPDKPGQDKDRKIPVVPCPPDGIWGIEDSEFKYTSPSQNAYQQRARLDLVLSPDKCFQHYTKHFSEQQVQNVCELPFTKGADYRHLEQQTREWSLRHPASAKAMGGFQGGAYTRLDPDGQFGTIVTNVGPLAKQSRVIHPFCNRILTVRELARAQGFPDSFIFYSDTDAIEDYHSQIGNSVPFGVSAALGRSIQNMVCKKWLKERMMQE